MADARDGWTESLSAAERVRMVAITVDEPRTANWIADEAVVAHETATKYLSQLVDDGQLVAERAGDRTVYRPDPVSQYLDEVRELYEGHSPDELATGLRDITEQIEGWRDEYGIETPNELRATIGGVEDAEEARTRQRIALEWDRLAARRSLVEDALRLHDRFPGESPPASA